VALFALPRPLSALAALIALLPWLACGGQAGPSASPPQASVVIYLIDALRADRLGAYGNERPISPRIDDFARRAILFERAWAQSSWTKSAVASIFTGVWPPKHGANRRSDVLPDEAQTLAEILRANGYWTGALSANPNIVEAFGFDQGFELFRFFDRGRNRSTALQEELEEIMDRPAGRPFFLYLHTVDPHSPYAPPSPFRERFAPGIDDPNLGRNQTLFDLEAGRIEATERMVTDLSALYQAEIAANDDSFGLLLDLLRRRHLEEDTVVVLMSDHGEEFNDHGGWTHGKQLYSESLAIPLIIRFPGLAAGRRVATQVQQIDLLPTLLDYLGIEAPPGLEGRSLLPLIAEGAASPPMRPLFSYLRLAGAPRATVMASDWKLIERYPRGHAQRWLYNLREDPLERVNRATENPRQAEALAALLAAKLAEPMTGEAPPAEIDDALRQELEALGYLQ
jgi:choline-sulfatase